MVFPVRSFLEELRKTAFPCDEEGGTYLTKDWEKTYEEDMSKTYYHVSFGSPEIRLAFEINKERFFECYVFTENNTIRDNFETKLKEIFNAIGYHSIMKKKDGTFVPMTDLTSNVFSWITSWIPNLQVIGPRNNPTLKIPHLRRELYLDIDYDKRCIDIYYYKWRIETIHSKKEAEEFLDLWMSRSETFKDIAEEVLNLCKKEDPSAFLIFAKSFFVHFFSKEMHLGFSYYLEEGVLNYFVTMHSTELGRSEQTYTDMEDLRYHVVGYMKKLIKTRRVKAAIQNKVNNYLYRLCYEILGYSEDVETIFCSFDGIEECKKYVREYYNKEKLLKLDWDLTEINKKFARKVFKIFDIEAIIFMDGVNEIYEFGKYLILHGDMDDHKPSILMIKKEELDNVEKNLAI